jgi:deoxyribonuclease V
VKLHHRHPWDLSTTEARALQEQLARLVVREDRFDRLDRVAGVDVGFEDSGRTARAAVVVLDYPGLELEAQAIARSRCRFPYVPGLLSFREVPAILEAMEKLRQLPDMVLCDGQGLAHPRRFGLACHLGVLTDIPTIGVAKTRLIGAHDEVPVTRGSWAPLEDRGERIGAVLRTRHAVNPLFISTGHRVSLESALRLTLACAPRYRLPETTRQAHRLASG